MYPLFVLFLLFVSSRSQHTDVAHKKFVTQSCGSKGDCSVIIPSDPCDEWKCNTAQACQLYKKPDGTTCVVGGVTGVCAGTCQVPSKQQDKCQGVDCKTQAAECYNPGVCNAVTGTCSTGSPQTGTTCALGGTCNNGLCSVKATPVSPPVGCAAASGVGGWSCPATADKSSCSAACLAAGYSGNHLTKCEGGKYTTTTPCKKQCSSQPQMSGATFNCLVPVDHDKVCTTACSQGYTGTPSVKCIDGVWMPQLACSLATNPATCTGCKAATTCLSGETCVNGTCVAGLPLNEGGSCGTAGETCQQGVCKAKPTTTIPSTGCTPACVNPSQCTISECQHNECKVRHRNAGVPCKLTGAELATCDGNGGCYKVELPTKKPAPQVITKVQPIAAALGVKCKTIFGKKIEHGTARPHSFMHNTMQIVCDKGFALAASASNLIKCESNDWTFDASTQKCVSSCEVMKPCKNGGKCHSSDATESGLFCVCPDGYSEFDCSVQLDKQNLKGCHNVKTGISKCQGRGKCNAEGKCLCEPGFTGENCESFDKTLDPCGYTKLDCGENGKCVADSKKRKGVKCECNDSTMDPDSFCENRLQGPCNPNPCTKGGLCHQVMIAGEVSYTCECPPGHRGDNCELTATEVMVGIRTKLEAADVPVDNRPAKKTDVGACEALLEAIRQSDKCKPHISAEGVFKLYDDTASEVDDICARNKGCASLIDDLTPKLVVVCPGDVAVETLKWSVQCTRDSNDVHCYKEFKAYDGHDLIYDTFGADWFVKTPKISKVNSVCTPCNKAINKRYRLLSNLLQKQETVFQDMRAKINRFDAACLSQGPTAQISEKFVVQGDDDDDDDDDDCEGHTANAGSPIANCLAIFAMRFASGCQNTGIQSNLWQSCWNSDQPVHICQTGCNPAMFDAIKDELQLHPSQRSLDTPFQWWSSNPQLLNGFCSGGGSSGGNRREATDLKGKHYCVSRIVETYHYTGNGPFVCNFEEQKDDCCVGTFARQLSSVNADLVHPDCLKVQPCAKPPQPKASLNIQVAGLWEDFKNFESELIEAMKHDISSQIRVDKEELVIKVTARTGTERSGIIKEGEAVRTSQKILVQDAGETTFTVSGDQDMINALSTGLTTGTFNVDSLRQTMAASGNSLSSDFVNTVPPAPTTPGTPSSINNTTTGPSGPPAKPQAGGSKMWIIGLIAGIVLVVACIVGAVVLLQRKKKKAANLASKDVEAQSNPFDNTFNNYDYDGEEYTGYSGGGTDYGATEYDSYGGNGYQ